MKIIDCYGGNYLVSKNGEIFNSKGLCMSQKNDSRGYYKMINISYQGKKKMFLVHRLVAQAFIPNPDNKPQVNHKDGNKHNNCENNLEWCTSAENNRHAFSKLGRKPIASMKGKFGKEHNTSKEVILINVKGDIKHYGSSLEAKRYTGIAPSVFTMARKTGLPYRFKRGKAKGFTMI